ncbi:MAG: response regulator [Chromatiales bacterium]|nr:response regulator [Chromatiales bacterium]
MLRGDRIEAPHRVYLEEIDKAGAHLLELINQVLDLAKIEAGRLELERVEFDPLRLLDEVTAVVAQRAHGKGLALRARVSPALPPLVIGDPDAVAPSADQLAGRTRSSLPRPARVGLSAQPLDQGEKVLVRVWDTGPGIDPAVLGKLFQPFVQADNSTMRRFGGSGLGLMICKELVTAMGGKIEVDSQVGQGSCFWFAVPLARSPRPVPRPMPLAGHECIVACANRSLAESLTLHVEALGGVALVADSADAAAAALNRMPRPPRLVVVDLACRAVLDVPALRTGIDRLLVMPAGESSASTTPEAITVMHFPVTFTQLSDWIAATARPEAGRRSGSEATAIPPLVCGAEHRLLLVEDNPVNQLVASAMLERLSVSFECAGDGIEALDKLERTRFDLVLMDVEMPEMDGLTATRELRRREKEAGRCRVPVIAMTANALAQDRERCLEAGMDAHMGKPVRLEELGATIERWLAAADGERTAASRSGPGVASSRGSEGAFCLCLIVMQMFHDGGSFAFVRLALSRCRWRTRRMTAAAGTLASCAGQRSWRRPIAMTKRTAAVAA